MSGTEWSKKNRRALKQTMQLTRAAIFKEKKMNYSPAHHKWVHNNSLLPIVIGKHYIFDSMRKQRFWFRLIIYLKWLVCIFQMACMNSRRDFFSHIFNYFRNEIPLTHLSLTIAFGHLLFFKSVRYNAHTFSEFDSNYGYLGTIGN